MFKRIIYIGYGLNCAIYYDRKKKIPLKEKRKGKKIQNNYPEISVGLGIFIAGLIGKISFDIDPDISSMIFWQIVITIALLYLSYKYLYSSKGYEPASYEEFYYALYNEKIIQFNKNEEYISIFMGIFFWMCIIITSYLLVLEYQDIFSGTFDYENSGSPKMTPFMSNYLGTPACLWFVIVSLFIWPFYLVIDCFRKFRHRTLFKDQELIYKTETTELNIYPLGSVVKIKGSDDQYIIINREIKIKEGNNKKYYDYAAYKLEDEINKEKEYNFNHWDISEIIYLSKYQKLRSEQDYQLIYPLIREDSYKMINYYNTEKLILPDVSINIIDKTTPEIVNEEYEKLIEDLKIEPFGIKKEGNDEK